MVDEEHLALVVAGPVAEAQGPFDDLLRRSHGQRGLRREVLEAGTVAVDRGVVEVGTELLDRILRVLPHEHLTAEADDRLLRRAVAVVLVALAVELDHARGVRGGPEDVVVEEAVTVVGGLLGDLGAADRPVPDERRDVVERPRGDREAVERRAELALPVEVLLPPQTVEEVVVLDRERDARADVLAEPRVDRSGVAAPHDEVEATVGQMLGVRVVLGDAHRVGRRDEGRRRRQLELLGLCGDVRQQHRRVGRCNERRVVVLAGGEHVEADLFGLLRELDRVLDPLVLRHRGAVRRVRGDVADGEDSEFHDCSSSLWSARSQPTAVKTSVLK
ncbi:Uncharacterised protein [Mycobacteroides abscessus subsp. abscessus]|nr:Uncharacterised protein [Mycobacteroides abscessus subsp. abscessus]